jgi:ApaG protein
VTLNNSIAEKIQITTSVTPIGESVQNFEGMNCFAYHISIRNTGSVPVQLISRHWLIKDHSGFSREVEGEGVVGKQPVILPEDSFDYESWCPIPGKIGSMSGHFTFKQIQSDELFQVTIPSFVLASPEVLN